MNKANNPLNIKQNPKDPWKWSIGVDPVGTAVFADPEDGIRAAMRSLQAKWDAGKRSLVSIIASWAPADDRQGGREDRPYNDPVEYAGCVAQRLGIGAADRLPDPRVEPEVWFNIIGAMAHYEMGEDCPPMAIMQGIVMWWEDFMEEKAK